MLGVLTRDQSIHILQSQVLARLGCYADKKVYVVPVTYVFDGKYVYVHSKEGQKIKMMRKNPVVCLQVDQLESMVSWRSVIAHGEYEELKTSPQLNYANQLLKERLEFITDSESVSPARRDPNEPIIVKELKSIVYRISILEISGRYEKPDLKSH